MARTVVQKNSMLNASVVLNGLGARGRRSWYASSWPGLDAEGASRTGPACAQKHSVNDALLYHLVNQKSSIIIAITCLPAALIILSDPSASFSTLLLNFLLHSSLISRSQSTGSSRSAAAAAESSAAAVASAD